MGIGPVNGLNNNDPVLKEQVQSRRTLPTCNPYKEHGLSYAPRVEKYNGGQNMTVTCKLRFPYRSLQAENTPGAPRLTF